MTDDATKVRVSLEQLGRVIRAINDLKASVLPENPELFATMSEGYFDQLERLRIEIDDLLLASKDAG